MAQEQFENYPRLFVKEIYLLILKSLLEGQGPSGNLSWTELLVGTIYVFSLYLANAARCTQFLHHPQPCQTFLAHTAPELS